jgi:hypothetical protein
MELLICHDIFYKLLLPETAYIGRSINDETGQEA